MTIRLKRLTLSLAVAFIGLCFFQPFSFASEQKIYDQANLFSSDGTAMIEEAIKKFEKTSNMEAIVVTSDEAHGKIARDYADDFFDQHQFGFGPEHDGILFLIDLNQRTYWISTHGRSIKLFTDRRIENLLDQSESFMRNGEYANAATTILAEATKYATNYRYDERSQSFKKVHRIVWYEGLIAVGIALVTGIGTFSSVFGSYNLKRSTYNYSYRDNGQLDLTTNEDSLVNTAVTTRYIPPRSNNGGGGGFGGGSSTHQSSGGSTHGGGGRGF